MAEERKKVRRYDDVLQVLLPVLLGLGLQYFQEVVKNLQDMGGSSLWAHLATGGLFLVFFRNVHGLIAYDVWAEATAYVPPFEDTSPEVAQNFVFATLAAGVLPSVAVYVIRNHGNEGGWLRCDPYAGFVIGGLLVAPMLIYVPWNIWWLNKRSSYTGQDTAAHLEIMKFTKRWLVIDGVVLASITAMIVCRGMRIDINETCAFVSVLSGAAIVADYLSHVAYYFPVPKITAGGVVQGS